MMYTFHPMFVIAIGKICRTYSALFFNAAIRLASTTAKFIIQLQEVAKAVPFALMRRGKISGGSTPENQNCLYLTYSNDLQTPTVA